MAILTKNAASKLDYAPSTAYLAQMTKADDRPGYLVEHNDKLMVDTDHKAWRDMIERRRDEAIRGKRRGADINLDRPENKQSTKQPVEDIPSPPRTKQQPNKKTQTQKYNSSEVPVVDYDDGLDELHMKAKKAKFLEPILKAESMQHKIEMNKLDLKKEAGDLIEYQLAEFLFLGYLEKTNLEMLQLPDKIQPIIYNLVKENKPDEILKLFKREMENILVEIKRAQKEDVRQWREQRE